MQKTWKPTTGGILAIIAGALQVIFGIVFATAAGLAGAFIGMGWIAAVGAPLIILGIVAIIGGIYATRRTIWGLALAGAICALIGPWFVLGILAVVFIALAKSEFA